MLASFSRPATLSGSWYAESTPPLPAFAPLAGLARCDVAVIGGGYTGLSAALTLAEAGFSVALLEARQIGSGASGCNGGQILSGFNQGPGEIAARVGQEAARGLWAMAEEAKALIRRRVARHAIPCALRSGQLYVALKPRHQRALEAMQADWQAFGYARSQLLDRNALGRHVASDLYCGGLWDGGAGHLHPLAYAQGLARAAAAAGAALHEHTPALAIDADGPTVQIHTPAGRVEANWLLLAGNAALGRLMPGIDRYIMPVGTFLVATAPLGEATAHALLPSDAAVTDMNFVLNYFRRSADHRLLFGGGVSYSGLIRPDLAQSLGKSLRRAFPRLADVPLTHCWGGNVAITVNRLPHFGRLGRSILFAHGFSGHGVALSGLAGQLMAEVVQGTAGRFDLFTRLPHTPFPGGGRLRTPALVLAMAWMRLRDWL